MKIKVKLRQKLIIKQLEAYIKIVIAAALVVIALTIIET